MGTVPGSTLLPLLQLGLKMGQEDQNHQLEAQGNALEASQRKLSRARQERDRQKSLERVLAQRNNLEAAEGVSPSSGSALALKKADVARARDKDNFLKAEQEALRKKAFLRQQKRALARRSRQRRTLLSLGGRWNA